MKLSRLLSAFKPLSVRGDTDVEITGLSEDTRSLRPGFAFFARSGANTSGIKHIPKAIAGGAKAVISQEDPGKISVPSIRVPSVIQAEALISDLFYDSPSRDLTIIGVTGTNGKTTFTYLMESIAREKGWRTGVIGTVNYRVPVNGSDRIEILPAPNTTPNPLELQKVLHLLRERKVDLVLAEVSSHALSLGRVERVEFDGAVFTNLTQDHLDFHETMEKYFEAKSRLFKTLSEQPERKGSRALTVRSDKFGIINIDDPYGKRLRALTSIPYSGYGIESRAEFTAKDIVLEPSGSCFTLFSPKGSVKTRITLIGRHNVYNALAAAAASVHLGVSLPVVARGLEKLKNVPGRLEPITCGQDFTVLVDYAHTEDALRNVLQALRQITSNRILSLFGCGGDRDRSKRPMMGAVAVELSDYVIVTSDNPRSEDPQKIAFDVEVGIRRTGRRNYEVVLDRGKAIEKILGMAKKGELVLLAGKGHEDYQIFADKTIHFDDREIARKFLSR